MIKQSDMKMRLSLLVLVVATSSILSGCNLVGACGNLCVACCGSAANGGGPANGGAVPAEVAPPTLAVDHVSY
jgi:hypothetical protein